MEINEIMYDLPTGSDDGREWVEIYNNSDTETDLSIFKFFEADTNHKMVLQEGSQKIFPRGYALIVSDINKFKKDWPNFSGTVFDSTFSLNNSGESLAIKNDKEIISQYFYQSSFGGDGDGKSLQKINGIWVSALPTPGGENKPEVKVAPSLVPPKMSGQDPGVPKEKVLPSSETTVENAVEPIVVTAENTNFSYIFIIILVLLLGAGGGAVYFIRKRKFTHNIADEFDILGGE